jgi:hypothetical protein
LVTRFDVSVPSGSLTSLVVGTGPVGPGTWTVTASGGTSTLKQTSYSQAASPSWTPVDLTLPLGAWRGKSVVVSLSYRGDQQSGASVPAFVEPRLVTSDGQP